MGAESGVVADVVSCEAGYPLFSEVRPDDLVDLGHRNAGPERVDGERRRLYQELGVVLLLVGVTADKHRPFQLGPVAVDVCGRARDENVAVGEPLVRRVSVREDRLVSGEVAGATGPSPRTRTLYVSPSASSIAREAPVERGVWEPCRRDSRCANERINRWVAERAVSLPGVRTPSCRRRS